MGQEFGLGDMSHGGHSGGGGSGKDPVLAEEERQDRLDNASDALDDARDNYKDAQAKLKLSDTTFSETEAKLNRDIAATHKVDPGGPLEQKWQEDLDKARLAHVHAQHAAILALHAQNKAERALTEATTKSEEPLKGGKGGGGNFGQSLIAGIGQELGFGDIFGTAPNEWGVFKMLGGAAQWAVGTGVPGAGGHVWLEQAALDYWGPSETGTGSPDTSSPSETAPSASSSETTGSASTTPSVSITPGSTPDVSGATLAGATSPAWSGATLASSSFPESGPAAWSPHPMSHAGVGRRITVVAHFRENAT